MIRKALRSASGVLLVVTPHILDSPYVKDELDIAKLYQRPVYPLWIEGTEWIDTVPLGWGRTQYIDARAERYEQALAQLVQLVQKLPSDSPSQSQLPKQESSAAQLAQKQPSDSSSQSQPTKQESAAAPRNPYKGLQHFTGTDVGDFFGREQLIAELVDEVKKALGKDSAGGEARLLTVIGASGSGKSSVIMAGLLPHLQQNALPGSQQWIYLERMVPGAHPLEELVQTLSYQLPERSHASLLEDLAANSARGLHLLVEHIARPKSTRVVLFIDQFEEVFTQTTDATEREQFLHVLTTAASEPGGALLIILALRADFYDRPMQYPALRRLLQVHQVAVWAMESADLRKVIEQPAALPDVQLGFEEDLVGDLLFELRGQAGALPLLEFTLDQLFQRRNGRLLTRQAYQEIGGVKGALAKHAEETYNEQLPSEEHRKLARALFLRLLEPGASEQETTRRRAALSEFVFEDQGQTRLMQETIEIFVKARLLSITTNESAGTNTIEVSHEALIREWPRLIGWLREAREDIRLQQSISEDAAEWEKHNKPGDRLYRGSQLKEAQAWARRNTPSGSEMAFLRAGVAYQVRFFVSVIAAVLVVVSSMGGIGWVLTHQPPKAPDPTRVSNLLDDDKPGSLRYAVNRAPSGSTITFDTSLQGKAILLTSGDLNIAKDLKILGPGAGKLAISGGKSGYMVHVIQGVTVTISGLTFKDSTIEDSNVSNGFIYNEGGTLMLSNSVVSGNTVIDGGGIYNTNGGTATLNNSIVSGNTETGSGGGGGGIFNTNRGTVTLNNSIVSGNTATFSVGGGIYNVGGTVTLSNSTI
ncbi:MAG: AAA family ATPase, partial [Chloroflexi bacterium]|nr:AAA family ATPase [Chloroflexota bacterium]